MSYKDGEWVSTSDVEPKNQKQERGMFALVRKQDFSGVSGTGKVLVGMIFPSGKCVIEWLTPKPHGSINIFDSFDDFLEIHVRSHPNNGSEIIYGGEK